MYCTKTRLTSLIIPLYKMQYTTGTNQLLDIKVFVALKSTANTMYWDKIEISR